MPLEASCEGVAAEGTSLGAGRFAVIRPLGAGGMGVVLRRRAFRALRRLALALGETSSLAK